MKRVLLIIFSLLLLSFPVSVSAEEPLFIIMRAGGSDQSNVTITGGSITGITDLLVADGGTGTSSLTDHCVVVGSGTGAVSVVAVGATKEILKGVTGADPDFITDRDFQTLSFINAAAQDAFTEAEMIAYSAINNQGAGEETDIILVAVSYPIKFTVETSEAFSIELCPPAGETFNKDFDAVSMDANDCILSSATVGASFVVKRVQIADGSWQYHTYTIQGVNTDGGPGD